jgi:hypothetical protein
MFMLELSLEITLKVAGAVPAMGTQFFFGQANGSDQII